MAAPCRSPPPANKPASRLRQSAAGHHFSQTWSVLMRNLRAGLATALILGAIPSAMAAEVVAPSSVPLAQSVVTLGAGVDAMLGSSTGRRYLCLLDIGTDLVTLGFDQLAVVG